MSWVKGALVFVGYVSFVVAWVYLFAHFGPDQPTVIMRP